MRFTWNFHLLPSVNHNSWVELATTQSLINILNIVASHSSISFRCETSQYHFTCGTNSFTINGFTVCFSSHWFIHVYNDKQKFEFNFSNKFPIIDNNLPQFIFYETCSTMQIPNRKLKWVIFFEILVIFGKRLIWNQKFDQR